MGPYRGGQAQYIRVPYADFNALKLPPGSENEADFIVRINVREWTILADLNMDSFAPMLVKLSRTAAK